MENTKKMSRARAIDELELYDLVVALYPEKFAGRDEAGDDLWDEVMEFVEDELVGELLCDEHGLRSLLGRVLLLTHPLRSEFTGELYHALGVVEVAGAQVQMMACARERIPQVAEGGAASSERQQSSSEAQQDRIDALRYRTIRESLAGGGRHTETPCVVHPLNSGVTYTPEGLDAALDEIRSQADCSHL